MQITHLPAYLGADFIFLKMEIPLLFFKHSFFHPCFGNLYR